MEDSFEDLSRNIANDFLRDIVFIDECAYKSDAEQPGIPVNAFDASEVSTTFCRAGKICAIYAPKKDTDINICIEAVKKADAVVLDWNLQLDQTMEYNPMADAKDDERGQYTKEIIDKILEDAGESKMKLIIVYTGESDLSGICGEISKMPYSLGFDRKELACTKRNVRILVRAKEMVHYEHNNELKDKVVSYEDLPTVISGEFAKLTMGLLSNYALRAITTIRDNTSNILGVFSKDIDAAYLGHYISVDNSEEAVVMLSDIFGSAITDLINANKIDMMPWIESWIDYHMLKEDRRVQIAGQSIKVNSDHLKLLVKDTSLDLKAKFQTVTNKEIGKEKIKREAIRLFSDNGDIQTPNYKFAQLIQHKDLFAIHNNAKHTLSTGTIVRYIPNDQATEKDMYLLCIQQRCDSVRIKGERTFLFLPLKESAQGEAIVINHKKHLVVDNQSYALKLYQFQPTESETQITTTVTDAGICVFKDCSGNLFEWIAELKELYAQHIVATYAAELSRVGVNNSEWMRLGGNS